MAHNSHDDCSLHRTNAPDVSKHHMMSCCPEKARGKGETTKSSGQGKPADYRNAFLNVIELVVESEYCIHPRELTKHGIRRHILAGRHQSRNHAGAPETKRPKRNPCLQILGTLARALSPLSRSAAAHWPRGSRTRRTARIGRTGRIGRMIGQQGNWGSRYRPTDRRVT